MPKELQLLVTFCLNLFESLDLTQIGEKLDQCNLVYPQTILSKFLEVLLDERDSISYLANRYLFSSVAKLFNECVFDILCHQIQKKIVLPPNDVRKLTEKLTEFRNLFESGYYIDVDFELECCIAGLSCLSQDDPGLSLFYKTFTSLSNGSHSAGVITKLISIAVDCHSDRPKMWYPQVFSIKGLSLFTQHNQEEFKDLQHLIEGYMNSKLDWHIFFICIQVLIRNASQTSDDSIRLACLESLQKLVDVPSNSLVLFLNHWSIKSFQCRYALVYNLYSLYEVGSDMLRSFALNSLNILQIREKSLGKLTKECILDLFQNESNDIRIERLQMHQKSVNFKIAITAASDISEQRAAVAAPSLVSPPTNMNIDSDTNPFDPDTDAYEYLNSTLIVSNSFINDLQRLCPDDADSALTADTSPVNQRNTNQYLQLLSRYEQLTPLLSSQNISRYRNDSNGFHRFLKSQVGPEAMETINKDLFGINRNYTVLYLVKQLLLETEQDNEKSLLDFLQKPSNFFHGKYLDLYDSQMRRLRCVEIKRCVRRYRELILIANDHWRLEISLASNGDHSEEEKISKLKVIRRVSQTLHFYFFGYYRQDLLNQSLEHVSVMSSHDAILSGIYSFHYSNSSSAPTEGAGDGHGEDKGKGGGNEDGPIFILINLVDPSCEYHLKIFSDHVQCSSLNGKTNVTLSLNDLQRIQMEFEETDEDIFGDLDSQSLAKRIKIRERKRSDDASSSLESQRSLLNQIEGLRKKIIRELFHSWHSFEFDQLRILIAKHFLSMSNLPNSFDSAALDSTELLSLIKSISSSSSPSLLSSLKKIESLYANLSLETPFPMNNFLLDVLLTSHHLSLLVSQRNLERQTSDSQGNEQSNDGNGNENNNRDEDISLLLELLDTIHLLDLAWNNSKLLTNQNTILFLGGTGAGKSTCVNYFSGIPLEYSENEFGHEIVQIDTKRASLLEINLQEHAAVIGQSLGTSETTIVRGYPVHFDPDDPDVRGWDRESLSAWYGSLSLVDFPGYVDTRGLKYDLSNFLSIDRVIACSKRVCAIFLILPYESFRMERCNPVIRACTKLKSIFPQAFSDDLSTLSLKQQQREQRKKNPTTRVQIVITKHSLYPGAENSFHQLLASICKDESTAAAAAASATATNGRDGGGQGGGGWLENTLKSRLEIWNALIRMQEQGCVKFVDIGDTFYPGEVIREYCQGEDKVSSSVGEGVGIGTPSQDFLPALEGPKVHELLKNSLEFAIHSWSLQIFDQYLQCLPRDISQQKELIQSLALRIESTQERLRLRREDHTSIQLQLETYEKSLRELASGASSASAQEATGLDLDPLPELQSIHLLLLRQELKKTLDFKEKLQKENESLGHNLDSSAISLRETRRAQELKKQQIATLSTGFYEENIWETKYDPKQSIKYRSVRLNSNEIFGAQHSLPRQTQQHIAVESGPAVVAVLKTDKNGNESAPEISIIASEYDGILTHLVPIHRDYLVTTGRSNLLLWSSLHQSPQQQLQQQHLQPQQETYYAICEGNNFSLEAQPIDEGGSHLIYIFKTFWGRQREELKEKNNDSYHPNHIPWISIRHLRSKALKNSVKISSLGMELTQLQVAASSLQEMQRRDKERLLKNEKDIIGQEELIRKLQESLQSEIQLEQKKNLEQIILELATHLSASTKAMRNEELSLERDQEELKKFQKKLRELQRKKMWFALLILSKLSTISSLSELCDYVQQQDSLHLSQRQAREGGTGAEGGEGEEGGEGGKHQWNALLDYQLEPLRLLCESDLKDFVDSISFSDSFLDSNFVT